jgi:hypothetical protein
MKYIDNYIVFENFTTLKYYCIENNIKKIKELVDKNTDVNIINKLLRIAINNNRYVICEYLINLGATLDYNDSIIFSSIFKPTEQTLKYCILAGVNVNQIEKTLLDNNYTPLINTSLYTTPKKWKKLKLLIDANADWNILNRNRLDFVDLLAKSLLFKLKRDYPKKYENYLKMKPIYKKEFDKKQKSSKFNL